MYKQEIITLLLTAVSPCWLRLYPGLCPELRWPLHFELNSIFLATMYVVPFEKYVPWVPFLPANNKEANYINLHYDGVLEWSNLDFNHDFCRFVMVLQLDNQTQLRQYSLTDRNYDKTSSTVGCKILTKSKIRVFLEKELLLIWECVDFEEEQQHDEAAWLLSRAAEFLKFKHPQKEVALWAMEQLKSGSSIQLSHFEEAVYASQNVSRTVKSIEDFYCPNRNCSFKFYYYIWGALGVAFFIIFFYWLMSFIPRKWANKVSIHRWEIFIFKLA